MKNKGIRLASYCANVLLIVALMAVNPAWSDSELDDFDFQGFDTSSPFIHPSYSKKISMDFENASLVDVLKIFSKQSGFNLITSGNIKNMSVTIYLDEVPVEDALEQILRANNLTYEVKPQSNIYVVKPLEQPKTKLITRVYQLKHATVSSAKIKNTLQISDSSGDEITSDEDKGIIDVLSGIITSHGQIIEDSRTNSLIITDIAQSFPQIERIIAKMDIPVPQILIEVEMLEVSKDTSDLIGVKVGNTPLTFTGGTRAHFYPWNQNRLLDKGRATLSDEFTTGTIDASGFAATLQFLRTQSDTKTMARPRIMTLNNEPAEIKISTEEAIGVKTETSSSQNLAQSSLEAERVETGVFLTVTPQANIETREITLAIDPKVIIARTGGTFANTTFKDPEQRGSKSILRIKDGDTIIVGGLLRTQKDKTITKVPLLGDIPLIGKAFRHVNDAITERELIIFITPHILEETPLPQSTMAHTREIIREQNIPFQSLPEVDQELSRKKFNR